MHSQDFKVPVMSSFALFRPLFNSLRMSSPPSSKSSPLLPNSSSKYPSNLPSPADSQSSLKLSRARLIQNYLDEHVHQWRDDILVQSLFANLPNREVKPEAFKQKYSFWKDLIIALTREKLLSGSVFKFTSKDLSGLFKRGGIHPVCLNAVISEMQSEGLALDTTTYDFSGEAKRSSLIGGMVNWVFGSLKRIMVSQGDDANDSYNEHDEFESKVPALILLPSLLKEQLDIIQNSLNISFMPLTFEEFFEIVNESRRREGLVEIVEKEDILLILKYLSSEGILNYTPAIESISEDTIIAIKIKSKVTSVDVDIVKLKRLHLRLNSQVFELSIKIKDLNELARRSVQISNDRKMAMYHLKRKALLEKVQGERLNSLHAIDEILLKISSVSDEAMILEAYKTGANMLNELLPNVKDVDDAVDRLQEVMADHNEITQALNQNNLSADFDEELEEELKALLDQQEPKYIKSTLSSTREIEEITDQLSEIQMRPYEKESPDQSKASNRVPESA